MRRERREVALIEYRLDELLRLLFLFLKKKKKDRQTECGPTVQEKRVEYIYVRTYRFKSSFRTSGLTPTKFRSMRDIKSSRNTTISCPKNFIRQGLLARWTLGILDCRRAVNEESRCFRGRTELTVKSRGPGTKTKCVRRVIRV